MNLSARQSAAALGAVGLAGAAQGAVHETNAGAFTGPAIQFNLQTGAVFSDFSGAYDFSLAATTSTGTNTKNGLPNTTETYSFTGSAPGNGAVTDMFNSVAHLTAGTVIGAGSTFNGGTTMFVDATNPEFPSFSTWTDTAPGNRGFVGFKFDLAGTNHYGWADVQVNEETTFTLHAFAYEDQPDTAITTPVPEPSAVGAFIAGAAGAAVLLRRRQRARG